MRLLAIERGSTAEAAVDRMNREAFPDIERLELEDMFRVAECMDAEVIGIYDGPEAAARSDDAAPIGFFMSERNGDCVYINYFAMDETVRGKGLGSEALKMILEYFGDVQVTLDFEIPEDGKDDRELRARRRNFYLRNGFFATGFYSVLRGVRFEVAANRKSFDEGRMNGLFAEISRCVDGFEGKVYRL